ncbi:MAG TPA: hypothetical protein VKC59_00340, partial [Candidatus Limnocylindrales bacterium]|nr:hypothetical protein [Candidatus Limnocylindrales bacterium]
MRTSIVLPLAIAVVIGACGGTPASTPTGNANTPSSSAPSSAAASPASVASPGTEGSDLAVARIESIPSPCELADGLGFVWVTSYSRDEVDAIDPASNAVIRTFAVPQGPCGVAVGFRSLWVSGGSRTVSRVDPVSGKQQAAIPIPGEIYDVQVGPDAVWASDRSNGSLVRIDPATNTAIGTYRVGASADGFRIDDGAIWVASDRDSALIRLNPADGSVVATIAVGTKPNWVAIADEAVWVENTGDGPVSRIDPATNA